MSQRFILAIDNGSAKQNDAITLYILGKGWHVWHWIGDIWLLSGMPLEVTPRTLWEELTKIPTLASTKMLVLKVEGESSFWGGISAEAWPWMSEFWGKADLPILADHTPAVLISAS